MSTTSHNTSLDYQKVKADAIRRQTLLSDIPLSDIELGRNQTLKIAGKILPVGEELFKTFMTNILGVPKKFMKQFAEVTNEKIELEMLETLRRGLAMKKNEKVTIVSDPIHRVIHNFVKDAKGFLTNEEVFKLFEMVMNTYGQLSLKDMHVDASGRLTLTARCNTTTNYGSSDLGNGKEVEDFNGGITFTNDPRVGSLLGQNAFRLVCENGMVRNSLFNNTALGLDNNSVDNMFKRLNDLAMNDFMFQDMASKIDRAKNTNASLGEFDLAVRGIARNSGWEREDAEEYFGLGDVRKFLAQKQVDYDNLHKEQWKNCPTNKNMWSLVNDLTWFASHDMGTTKDGAKIQANAGYLFDKKKLDVENLVIFN